jgi:NitT/TauT family transport system substrate-binding protein
VVNKAIDMELQYKIPAQTLPVDRQQWDKLISMQKYLGNVGGTLSYSDVIDNTFSNKAVKTAVAGADVTVAGSK